VVPTSSTGSFAVRVFVPSLVGSDTVAANAVNNVTGETCAGSLVFTA